MQSFINVDSGIKVLKELRFFLVVFALVVGFFGVGQAQAIAKTVEITQGERQATYEHMATVEAAALVAVNESLEAVRKLVPVMAPSELKAIQTSYSHLGVIMEALFVHKEMFYRHYQDDAVDREAAFEQTVVIFNQLLFGIAVAVVSIELRGTPT